VDLAAVVTVELEQVVFQLVQEHPIQVVAAVAHSNGTMVAALCQAELVALA
jgi:p-aminobenzoyl-glutamate transporter AbgT